MDLREQRAALAKPQIAKLKSLGKGLRIGIVLGERVLVKPVVPWTDMDEVEKKGLLFVPESVKKDYTPLPSTGIIVQVGLGITQEGADPVVANILQPGVGVMFSKYGGTDFIIEQETFKILTLDEIMATFDDDEAEIVAVSGT